MNIHEYQAKGLLREFGVPVPDGFPVLSAEDAEAAALTAAASDHSHRWAGDPFVPEPVDERGAR